MKKLIKEKVKVKDKYFFLFLLLFMFILASCTSNISNITDKKLNCNTGSQGLNAYFDSNNDNILREDSVKTLKVYLNNLGVFDSYGFLKLKYNPDLFNVYVYDKKQQKFIDDDKIKFFIEGKKNYNECKGETKLFLFQIKPYKLPLSVNKLEQQLSLDVCYKYGFNFTTNICVKKETGEINALGDSCVPKEEFFTGQGSPLIISKISKPEVVNNKVKFKVFFENKDSGFITADKNTPNSLEENCNLNNNLKNYIYIKAFLDNYRLNCNIVDSEIEGKMKLLPSLEENSYFLECSTIDDVNLDSTMQMTFNAEIYYYYNKRNSDNIDVVITR